MKRWLKIGAVVLAVVLGVGAITGIVLAQGPQDVEGACGATGDEFGDGYRWGWQDKVGNDVQGRGWQYSEPPCDDFVDEDGDGVCDLCGEAWQEQMMRGYRANPDGETLGQGRGRAENGEAMCEDFVDEDGDGVCDDHDENALGTGEGYGARGSQRTEGGWMGGRRGSRSNGK